MNSAHYGRRKQGSRARGGRRLNGRTLPSRPGTWMVLWGDRIYAATVFRDYGTLLAHEPMAEGATPEERMRIISAPPIPVDDDRWTWRTRIRESRVTKEVTSLHREMHERTSGSA